MNFINFLDSSSKVTKATKATIRIIGKDLRGQDSEIFSALQENEVVIKFNLIPDTWNAIEISTGIDLLEDLHDFTELVLEPLRQLGYDVRLTNI